MTDRHRLVSVGVGVLSRAHCYSLRLIPIFGRERQGRLVHRDFHVFGHLHSHGHIRRRLRSQYHCVAGAIALVHRQFGRGHGRATHIVVGDWYRRAGHIAHPVGCTIRNRRCHQAVYFVHVIIHCRHWKCDYRLICCECRLSGCSVGEECTALGHAHRHRQWRGQVADARQHERHCLAFFHRCRVCGHAHHRQIVVGDHARRLAIFDRRVGSIDQHDCEHFQCLV